MSVERPSRSWRASFCPESGTSCDGAERARGLAPSTRGPGLRSRPFTGRSGPSRVRRRTVLTVSPISMRRPRQWSPRTPEEILALKVCDPACGSGTFPVAALRFLTDALYASLHHHGRISETGDRAIVRLLDRGAASEAEDLLGTEKLACRPSDETFEPRLKAVLRRHVVERCIYGVDLDPLAVELCRLGALDRDDGP